MKVHEILKRINGVSTPWLGVSWDAKGHPTGKDQARELVAYLEDRRVLYNPSQMEVPYQCVESVLDIRRFLTSKIGTANDQRLISLMKGMRSACRKFLDAVGADERIPRHGHEMGHWSSWVFNGALGELRGVVGIYLAGIVAIYELPVDDDLASILPIGESAE